MEHVLKAFLLYIGLKFEIRKTILSMFNGVSEFVRLSNVAEKVERNEMY